METGRPNSATDVRPRFSSVKEPEADPHINGEYLKTHPTWHVEFSPGKAANIEHLMRRNALQCKTVCEVGCGAGEVLRQLQLRMPPDARFWGYDVSPQAIEMAKSRENDRLKFDVADFGELETPPFDLLLVLEVVDHIEDYLGFLRMLKSRATWKIFSFSLDISVQSALRSGALLQRRQIHSHLHHFNKETVIQSLKDTGYDIVDAFSPAQTIATNPVAKLLKPLTALTYRFSPDLTVRLLGGSLLVLAR